MAHKNGTNWGKPEMGKYWPVEKYENLFSLYQTGSLEAALTNPILAPKKGF